MPESHDEPINEGEVLEINWVDDGTLLAEIVDDDGKHHYETYEFVERETHE
jgi:hypothetical protein